MIIGSGSDRLIHSVSYLQYYSSLLVVVVGVVVELIIVVVLVVVAVVVEVVVVVLSLFFRISRTPATTIASIISNVSTAMTIAAIRRLYHGLEDPREVCLLKLPNLS